MGIYLDHAATTPPDPRVLEAMLRHLREVRGNPSSIHSGGVAARNAIEEAREEVARLLGAEPQEIIFTGGGTEADNLAVFGLARAAGEKRHIVAAPIEHPAVRNAVKHLEAGGYEVTWLEVDAYGVVDPEAFRRALRPDTAFATVMWANNEVGSVQPVAELAEICRECGVPFHTDAVQAVGHLPVSVEEAPVFTLAFSGHKLYGPPGVGVLYVREGVELAPVSFGGGQERGLRNGTENVAGICGLGVACRIARAELEERMRHERELRDRIISGLTRIPGVSLNGHPERRLPNNVHVSVDGVEAEGLVLVLDAQGFAVGKGSACSSGEHKASPVLLAMGLGEREAFSAVRISVGRENTVEEVDRFVEAFSGAVAGLRELSPLRTGG
ncbi:cysteine desulfurase [Rubrobacter taiwanensis]|jgi:cysteine desulfurase|uniref:Cysteine desulfurase n=1 Tax=Rubrobacter taiwanensis TaxID=185139 RepID=A0A4R1BHE0_9ACTN|nr:cysteine desulfurase family protein [Rubrobacter taiwanensis]TCJ16696.1 cysteine desulfurase [Rubrobacter taiwanensis]